MHFHIIFKLFHAILAISTIFGQFQHMGCQKLCTQAEKFIEGNGRGRMSLEDPKAQKRDLRPPKGAQGPPNRSLKEVDFLAQRAKTF